MAWVRFPDGTRRKVERVEKADAESDLNELLAVRAAGGALVPGRQRLVSFNEVLDDWLVAGCPSAAPRGRTRHARPKADSTIDNARRLLATHIRPAMGMLWVDRTRTDRIERVFARMGEAGSATSTIDHTWDYLNQACRHALRLRNMRRDFQHLCERAGLGANWTTYELRHSFVSLVADQLDDLVKVADLVGHRDPRTAQGYPHPVRSSLPHAIQAWDALLAKHAFGP